MRIKAIKASFMIGSTLVLANQEVDAPEKDALYLISIGVAEEISGGKGASNKAVEAKELGQIKNQVTESINKLVDKKTKGA